MIATHNKPALKEGSNRAREAESKAHETTTSVGPVKNSSSRVKIRDPKFNKPTPLLLPSRMVTHNPKAGLNPIADAAAYLFTILGKLKSFKSYRQLSKLQKELIEEINTFQETIKNHGYNPEYTIVCRYVLCATCDDIISNTVWGGQGRWETYSLLASFNQDIQHQEKFFTIMERAIKEPTLYIDLMELMYVCLSMGYKGQYRSTEHSQFQLEQITHNLYKHIRTYRGSFSKTLSPTPLKVFKPTIKAAPKNHSPLFIFLVTACVIMTIFISLGYIMDVISNETDKTINQIEKPVSDETIRQ
jgi:type VI secretion system protein ImpK